MGRLVRHRWAIGFAYCPPWRFGRRRLKSDHRRLCRLAAICCCTRPPKEGGGVSSARDHLQSFLLNFELVPGAPSTGRVGALKDWGCPQCATGEPHGTMSLVRSTVLIVDDHEDFRDSARALLEAEGFEVIGEASDGTEALAAVAALRPSIVLLDIQLPGVDGFSVAEQIAEISYPPVVVLISSRDAAAYGPRLVQTSARGFLPKSALSGEALAALVG